VAQYPAAGTGTRPGARVSVVVAGGPDVQVPDVRGRTEGAALQILRSIGLDAGRRSEYRTDAAQAGHVMRTRPRAGSTVAMGSCVDYVIGHSPWYGGGAERRDP
jgi:serine/threonine-protein kinase